MREIMLNIRLVTFQSIDEVYNNKEKFRDIVCSFDEETLEVYKWYFYHQLCLLNRKRDRLKDYMWEYLVGKDVLPDLTKEYRLFSNIKEKVIQSNEKAKKARKNHQYISVR